MKFGRGDVEIDIVGLHISLIGIVNFSLTSSEGVVSVTIRTSADGVTFSDDIKHIGLLGASLLSLVLSFAISVVA